MCNHPIGRSFCPHYPHSSSIDNKKKHSISWVLLSGKRGSSPRLRRWHARAYINTSPTLLKEGEVGSLIRAVYTTKKALKRLSAFERKTRLELATPTLARLCSTNWAISAFCPCSGRESNPYGHFCPQDFKSCVSTYSTTRAQKNYCVNFLT